MDTRSVAKPVIKKKAARKDIRKLVLDAAIDLVAASMTAQISLDAVATHAGVSKGGLQHHFKSKTALLKAVVDRVVETFDEELKRATGGDTASSKTGDPLSVYLERSFSGLGARMPTAKVVFAVQAYDPELLAPLHDYFRQRFKNVSDDYGEKLGDALALMLMADGLWMFDAIGAELFKPPVRKRVLAAALRWAGTVQPKPTQR